MCAGIPEEIQNALGVLSAHYKILSENDRGANGFLFFARNIVTQQDVAIKFYSGEGGDRRHDEPRQLAQIVSPNVLRVLDAQNISETWAFFVTPKCEGGDLDDFIQTKPPVHTAIDVALGICAGVSAIHAGRMLHRDLKPGNIVVENGRPLIADFGSVRSLPAGAESVVASGHSILFRPPESFDANRYSLHGDVYQVGVVTYQLLGGKLPYNGLEYLRPKEHDQYNGIADVVEKSLFVDAVIGRRIRDGSLLEFSSLPPWIAQGARNTIRRMVSPNPDRRFQRISDAAAALTHMRASLSNWRWVGVSARLDQGSRVIELRPTDSAGEFAAFLERDGKSRRAPAVGNATLAELVRRFS